MDLQEAARDIRATTFRTMCEAGGGHFGGCMSVIEILTALYGSVMHYDPKNPVWQDRDRLILSKGHAGPALYTTLSYFGFFEKERLSELDHDGGRLAKHADRKVPGVDFSTGSLGMGLSVAVGMAMAARLNKKEYRTYAILGDGELDEGQIWEAVMTAAQYNLGNLCAIVDRNRCQIDGVTEAVMTMEPLAQRWEDFGWNVLETDGHNIEMLKLAFEEAEKCKFRPTVILANTIKGKGISFMEDTLEHQVFWHAGSVSKELRDAEMHRLAR